MLTISAFIEKLPFYRRFIGHKFFTQFLCLIELNACLSDDMLLIFVQHLKNVQADMKLRFRDLSALDIPPWILDHFQTTDIISSIVIELIDLRNDFELKHVN